MLGARRLRSFVLKTRERLGSNAKAWAIFRQRESGVFRRGPRLITPDGSRPIRWISGCLGFANSYAEAIFDKLPAGGSSF
jgi:hypothetical protein